MLHKNSDKGFSLIELLIVVAIIGVLGFIAYPNYQQFVQDGKRNATKSFMMELASQQSNYLQDNREYAAILADLNVTASEDVTNNYAITISIDGSSTIPNYLITASPLAASIMSGDGDLTLNHLGVKTPSAKW
ncbi:type IV pilin protein [Litoribrevibacter euphylliae]|uniref:Type IV pilin protein n=1 Tax=Litoribrevibacter euphylliae TaxID=1834034 RepID=A0ABV7HD96_9GAMM